MKPFRERAAGLFLLCTLMSHTTMLFRCPLHEGRNSLHEGATKVRAPRGDADDPLERRKARKKKFAFLVDRRSLRGGSEQSRVAVTHEQR